MCPTTQPAPQPTRRAPLHSESSFPHISPRPPPRANLSGLVTQPWNIPDRPKPGRKPKENKIRKLADGQRSNHSIDPCLTQQGTGDLPLVFSSSGLQANHPAPGPSPQALQQKYIDSLEEKIETLQKHHTEQTNYYKTLASQSTSQFNALQKEKNDLVAQVNVLREEMSRLRKQISRSGRPGTNVAPIVIDDDASVRHFKACKQTLPEPCRPVQAESLNSAKKPRTEAETDFTTHRSDFQRANADKLVALATVAKQSANLDSAQDSVPKGAPGFAARDIDCGLCTSELDCVCRQVGLKPPTTRVDISGQDISGCLAVPIRRRSHTPNLRIWAVSSDNRSENSFDPLNEVVPSNFKECSGNPQNCPACCDDPFGQAFCTAINTSSASHSRSPSSQESVQALPVPSDPVVDAYTNIPCCGDPQLCGSQNCFHKASLEPAEAEVSCSDAWRQLKAHPNIGMANLQLLAEVVARRSYGSGVPPRDAPCDSTQATPTAAAAAAAVGVKTHREEWDPSSHSTLATVFENITGVPPGVVDQADGNSTQQSVAATSAPGGSRKTVKYVKKRALEDALLMLDRSAVLNSG